MIYGPPWGLHSQPFIGFICKLNWTGREIDKLRLPLFRAVSGYWLDGWRTSPTADTASIGANAGPLATWPSCVLPGEQSHFLCLRTRVSAKNGCPTGVLAAQCRGNWRQSANPTCSAACRCQGSGALKFWTCDRNDCLTHWACGTSTGLGSNREEPWKKCHWISQTHLRQDIPEGGVHLLSNSSPLVLLFLNHSELLVLIILGQPFQFEGQPPFKLSFQWHPWPHPQPVHRTGLGRRSMCFWDKKFYE